MNVLTVNVKQIVKNYYAVKKCLPNSCSVACVVKSDCYGLSLEKIVPSLSLAGCNEFYIATIEEGIRLRKILKNIKIFVLHGIQEGQEKDFIEYGLIPVLNNEQQVIIWENYAKYIGTQVSAILNIDTGMTRLGVDFKLCDVLIGDIKRNGLIDLIYISSHLSCADDIDNNMNCLQLKKFQSIVEKYPEYSYSFANSAGFLLGREYWYAQVRIGIILYGGIVRSLDNLKICPVIDIKSQIIQIYKIKKKVTVGYSATYSANQDSVIATIPIGYADGYMRCLSNKGYCCINGYKAPIVGNISMDLMSIDITNIPKEYRKLGENVEIIGNNISLETMASMADTISYEVLTSIGHRYNRIYVY